MEVIIKLAKSFSYKVGISADEHDQFVKGDILVNLLQSSAWAEVKRNWKNERIGIYKNEELVGVMSLSIKPLPLNRSMIYIPRGPIIDYQNKELVAYTFSILKRYARNQKAIFVKCDPAILLRQFYLGETALEIKSARETILQLVLEKMKWSGPTTHIYETIQARYQANRFLCQNMEDSFPKHTRRLMKDAERRGVVVYRAKVSDLPHFSALIFKTEQRKKISLRDQSYFKTLMETYNQDAFLHLAKINLSEQYHFYQAELVKTELAISQTLPHQKKKRRMLQDQKRSLENYRNEFKGYLEKYPKELIIAGVLSISYGRTMEMLYAGMNADFKKFYPQYLLYPKVCRDAYDAGIQWANMGGVEGSFDDGLTQFKSHFKPVIQEFIGEFTLPTSCLYYPFHLFYSLRKRLKNKH